jgi:Helix-turn-helix of DDE superfamily endonuclease
LTTRWNAVLKYNEDKFLRLTGVRRFVFDEMVEVLKSSEKIKFSAGGRPAKLAIEDQILLLLQYYREYCTLFSAATSYGVSEPTAWRIVVKIEKILISSGKFSLPGKKDCLNDRHDHFLIDVTESPIERPKKRVQVELKTFRRIFTQERRKSTR